MQKKLLKPVEHREIVSGDSLVAPPPALVGTLVQRVLGSTGQSISPQELQHLVDGGMHPIRAFAERPEKVTHAANSRTNLLLAMLARGNAPCLRWILERYDLSEFVFTGELGRRIAKELLTRNSGPMVTSLLEAGLHAGGALDALHNAGKAPFDRPLAGSVTEDYALALSNSPVLSYVDGMLRTEQLEKPGYVFSKLLHAQTSDLTMHMVHHFARACGGVQATDFSAQTSRNVICRLLLTLKGRDRQQALAQLIEWGFDRYPVEERHDSSTSAPFLYLGASDLGVPLLEFMQAAQFGLEECDAKGRTLLMNAVEKSDLPAVKWLVANGAQLDARTKDGDSVMHVAVKSATLPVIEYLHTVGAPVSLRNKDGKTPLGVYSNGCNGSDYLSLLVGRSIPMGRTLAMLAVQDGCDALLEDAIGGGDDVNSLDDEGNGIASRLSSARARKNPRIFELLGQAGFNFDVLMRPHNKDKDKDLKVPLLHLYCSQGQDNKANAQVVRYMVRAGASVDIKDSAGQTALHVAIKELNRPAVEALLELGADPTIKLGRSTTLQMTKDEEIKRMLTAARTGRVISNAMGGHEDVPEPAEAGRSDPLAL